MLFEAPSASVPLQDMSASSNPLGSPNTNLLSSFQQSLHDDANGVSKNSSDDRLDDGESVEGVTRSMQETMFNAESSSTTNNRNGDQPGTSGTQGNGSGNAEQLSSGKILSMSTVCNGFNILDRVFKRKGASSTLLSSHSSNMHSVGGGSENDGVFNNMSAKPDANPQLDSDKPPTYDEAAADATPPYWENSILSPGFEDEVFVDGLPVGNIVNFLWNLMVSSTFQFVGFLLTYVLHTSHAAKQGSRAGLGITFMTYSYTMFPSLKKLNLGNEDLESERIEISSPTNFDEQSYDLSGTVDHFDSSLSSGADMSVESTQSTKAVVFSCFIAALGVYIFVKAFIDYHRARKMEEVILAPPSNLPQSSPEEIV